MKALNDDKTGDVKFECTVHIPRSSIAGCLRWVELRAWLAGVKWGRARPASQGER